MMSRARPARSSSTGGEAGRERAPPWPASALAFRALALVCPDHARTRRWLRSGPNNRPGPRVPWRSEPSCRTTRTSSSFCACRARQSSIVRSARSRSSGNSRLVRGPHDLSIRSSLGHGRRCERPSPTSGPLPSRSGRAAAAGLPSSSSCLQLSAVSGGSVNRTKGNNKRLASVAARLSRRSVWAWVNSILYTHRAVCVGVFCMGGGHSVSAAMEIRKNKKKLCLCVTLS